MERKLWQERREQDFWAMLATGTGKDLVDPSLQRLQTLLQSEYSVCPACSQKWEPQDGTECSCLSYETAVQPPFTIKRSVADDGRLLVSVECEESDDYPIVRLVVQDSDIPELSEVKTEALWIPPSEEERNLWQKLREAESRLESFDAELGKCECESPSRVKLTFELDSERGTLFAIADVRELSVLDNKLNQTIQYSGAVRFVCDPQRCKWLEVPPASGETWIISLGRMIGRDKKGRPIIVANPQQRVDESARREIKAEIEKNQSRD